MQKKLKWCFYATLAGLLSGLSASIFLILLDYATRFRLSHESIVYALPLAGLLIGLLYHHYGKDIQPGTNLILDEIRDPQKITPIKMSPAILFTTLITHLFGGSAGREGTVVQMGASLSDQLARIFPISPEERKILLVAGAGAGFGAALGAPWAGIFFGMEVICTGRLKLFAVIECLIASFIAFGVTRALGAPHTHFPQFPISFSFGLAGAVLLASLLFAMIARSFLLTTHTIERGFQKWISYPPLKPLIGGILLVILFKSFSLEAYEGLGFETLLKSFSQPLPASVFILKLLLTALTLGAGFKGGEFVPLIFMGATSGAFLGGLTHTETPLLAALGCVALFGAASKTPVTCSIMAIELFGFEIAPYAIVACFLSSALSGRKTIYRKHAE